LWRDVDIFGTVNLTGIISPANVSTFTTAALNCLLAAYFVPNDEIRCIVFECFGHNLNELANACGIKDLVALFIKQDICP